MTAERLGEEEEEGDDEGGSDAELSSMADCKVRQEPPCKVLLALGALWSVKMLNFLAKLCSAGLQ